MIKTRNTKAPRKAKVNDQPWWYAQCLQNIEMLGGTPCADLACESNPLVARFAEAYCNCQPPFPNGCIPIQSPPPNCCAFTSTSPLPVLAQNCYCCCACFANSTPVAFDKGQYKALVGFEVGDMIYVADDINLTSWSQRRVMFSAGAGDLAAPSLMVKVTFGSPDKPDYLLVSRAQLFLIPGGKLKPAAALIPGQDSLVATDGTSRQVLSLEVGMFNKGLHHISTSTSPATSPEGHLIVAKDIVAGDWALQIALSTDQSRSTLSLAEGVEEMPEFGTKEYEQSLAKLKLDVSPFRVAVSGLAEPGASTAEFAPFSLENAIDIPDDAFAFLTPEQAADIAANGTMAPPSSQSGKESVLYLFKLFGAFYPTVNFLYDEQNQEPNAYFFEDGRVMNLVVTGGLAACQTVKFECMALVIATMIGAIASGPPFNEQGLSCLGSASYSAVGSTMPHVWIGMQVVPIIKAALVQVTELFGLINPDHQGGGDTCMDISLACRMDCMNAGFTIAPLPPCAGGPPTSALAVTGAKANFGVPHSTVTVSFNMNVDLTTANQRENYELDPLAHILFALVSANDQSKVLLTTDLRLKTKYKLTVTGVLSEEQQPLVPGDNTATFTTRK
jgi:hypothetical protein